MNLDSNGHRSVDVIQNGLPASWKVLSVPCLFSIGYEGKSIAAFIDTLNDNGISALVDVRYTPISRKPGFSKTALGAHLKNGGVDYFHIPQLGVPSQYRKNLRTEESYRILFEYYDNCILPANSSHITELKELLTQYGRLAIMCFEADYRLCHRNRITGFLSRDDTFSCEIIHL